MDSKLLYIRAGIAGLLVTVSAATLFLPLAEGANSVRDMFILLTGIAVKSFYDGVQEDKRVESIKQAYDPSPPQSYVEGR